MIPLYVLRCTLGRGSAGTMFTELAEAVEKLVPSLSPVSVHTVTEMPSLSSARTVEKMAHVGEHITLSATGGEGRRFAAIIGLDACREFNLKQAAILEEVTSWRSNSEIKNAPHLRGAIVSLLKHAMRDLSTPCFKIHRYMGAVIVEVRESLPTDY